MHLAEGRDHEAGREERVAGTPAATVGAVREQRSGDEGGTDQALCHDQHRSRSWRQGRRRVGGDRVERFLRREHRQLVLDEGPEQDEDGDRQRRTDEHEPRPQGRRPAAEGRHPRQHQQHGAHAARHDPGDQR